MCEQPKTHYNFGIYTIQVKIKKQKLKASKRKSKRIQRICLNRGQKVSNQRKHHEVFVQGKLYQKTL